MREPSTSLPVFQIELDKRGLRSRVWMNGKELGGVRHIKVEQGLDEVPTVTLQFLARSVNQVDEPR